MTMHDSISVCDSHQHFWRLRRGDYSWLTPDMGVLYRDYEPEHLRPILDATGVESTILVQAAPTIEETRFLLELSRQHSFVVGVVGWIDMESPQAPEVLEELCAHEKFVGVRPMVQDIADPQWLLRPTLTNAIAALVERDLTFDALVRPPQMPALLDFCARYPELRIVLDHVGKPPIAARELHPWSEQLRQLARHEKVRCKLSGLVTEAGNADATALRPYVDHVLDCFGAQRTMWGSDWPVCETVCRYGDWFALCARWFEHASPRDRASLFGEVARETYLAPQTRRRKAH